MAESKQPKKRHVKAAKDWLQKAEQSFDREEEARGDLNLMLARAELARAAEAQASGRRKRLRAWLKECVAAGAALLLVVLGIVFLRADALPASAPQLQHAPEAIEEVLPPAAAAVQGISAAEARREVIETIEKEEKQERPVVRAARETPMPDVALPDAQMRRLMREAGKSLRGQPPLGN